jgi:translocation and assembly module TamB
MRVRRIAAWAVGGVVGAAALLFAGVQTGPGKRALAWAASSSSLEVTGITGFVPTDLAIAKVELRDKAGTWLAVEGVHARWSFLSLFTGRLRIDEVTARKIDVTRAPLSDDKPSSGGSVPGLPVGIDLGRLAVDDIHLGAPLGGGVDSHWTVAGNALLAAHAPGHITLDMKRTDGPAATVAANLGFDLHGGW